MASAVSSSSFHCLPSSSRFVPSPTPQTRVRFQKPRAVSAVYAAAAPSTLYEVLGIQNQATCQEIKSAYRSLARVLHPDVNDVVSADDFIRVREAYSTLSDPAKRADYDRALFIRRRLGEGPQFVGERGPVSSRFTRRSWETDQCW